MYMARAEALNPGDSVDYFGQIRNQLIKIISEAK